MNSEHSAVRKSELRAFSKENDPKGRRQLAAELRQEHTGLLQEKDRLRLSQESLESEQTQVDGEQERCTQAIDTLKLREGELSASLVGRTLGFLELRRVRQQIAEANQSSQELEGRSFTLDTHQTEIDSLLEDQDRLGGIRSRINEYYSLTEGRYQEYNLAERIRDISRIGEEYGVSFVHSLNSEYSPTANSFLKGHTDWVTKLRILRAFGPTVASSSIDPEHSELSDLWFPVGIILNKGSVEYATQGDAGTVASGISSRSTNRRQEPQDMAIEIDHAVAQRAGHGYNEIGIKNPGIAGIFIWYSADQIDEGHPLQKIGHLAEAPNSPYSDLSAIPDIEEVYETAASQGLPAYVLAGGEYLLLERSPEGNYRAGKKMGLQHLRSQDFSLSDEEKRQVTEEILGLDIFKIESAEYEAVRGAAFGELLYISKRPDLLQDLVGMPGIYRRLAKEGGVGSIPEGVPIEELLTIQEPEAEFKIFRYEGKIWVRRIDRRDRELTGKLIQANAAGSLEQDSYALGYGLDMAGWIAQAKSLLASNSHAEISGKTDISSSSQIASAKIAAEVLGASRLARKFGDSETADALDTLLENFPDAKSIAEKALLTKRSDEGRFLATREDLG